MGVEPTRDDANRPATVSKTARGRRRAKDFFSSNQPPKSKGNFTGPVTFMYTIDDNLGATSNVAMVTVEVS